MRAARPLANLNTIKAFMDNSRNTLMIKLGLANEVANMKKRAKLMLTMGQAG